MHKKAQKMQPDPRIKPYGGVYYNTRAARALARPVTTSKSMHLVLRSGVAKGAWRLTTARNRPAITAIIRKCARNYSVRIVSYAINVNHLHVHLRLRRQSSYLGFIRALTAGIAMAVTGWGRGKPKPAGSRRFWQGRPFTSIVATLRYFRNLQRYIQINQLEGCGSSRIDAHLTIAMYEDALWRVARKAS